MTQRLTRIARPLTLATLWLLGAIAVLGCCCPSLPPPLSVRDTLRTERADASLLIPNPTPSPAPAR